MSMSFRPGDKTTYILGTAAGDVLVVSGSQDVSVSVTFYEAKILPPFHTNSSPILPPVQELRAGARGGRAPRTQRVRDVCGVAACGRGNQWAMNGPAIYDLPYLTSI